MLKQDNIKMQARSTQETIIDWLLVGRFTTCFIPSLGCIHSTFTLYHDANTLNISTVYYLPLVGVCVALTFFTFSVVRTHVPMAVLASTGATLCAAII